MAFGGDETFVFDCSVRPKACLVPPVNSELSFNFSTKWRKVPDGGIPYEVLGIVFF